MNRFKTTLSQYLQFLPLLWGLSLILRVSEYLLVNHSHFVEELFVNELIGFLSDWPVILLFFIFFYPVYALVSYKSQKWSNRIVLIFWSFITLIHLMILQYFSYFLMPVSRFLKSNTPQEISFSLSTSDLDVMQSVLWGGLLIVAIAFPWLFRHFWKGKMISNRFIISGIIISIILTPFAFHWLEKKSDPIEANLRLNKSLYFYRAILQPELEAETSDSNVSMSKGYQSDHPSIQSVSEKFPFLSERDINSVLKNYFNDFDTHPNIVVLIVEGLGTRFLDPMRGLNLMPFMDGLVEKSLYWPNCLTSTERSFGAVPSLLGSLPFGDKGFTFVDPMPNHLNLIHLLKKNRYKTCYFYGQGAWFHRKDIFLHASGIDLLCDNSRFSDRYSKVIVGKDHFFWGYNDRDLFDQSFDVLDTLMQRPMLLVYFTGTTHAPFFVPDEETYNQRLDSLLKQRNENLNPKYIFTYRKCLRTVLFADDALKHFFERYRERADYANTIFVITGDHPMTEIPIHSWLERYRVPMIIYSPQLKGGKKFPAVVSHFDVMPTLISLLSDMSGFEFPDQFQSLGIQLDTCAYFRNQNPVALMNTDREITSYFDGTKFLADGNLLFNVDSNMYISKNSDARVLKTYMDRLERFKESNRYVCFNNGLIPDSLWNNWRQ